MNDYELNYSESITVNDEIMNIRVLARKCGLPVMLFLPVSYTHLTLPTNSRV